MGTSQWKFMPLPGQLSAVINKLPGNCASDFIISDASQLKSLRE